jgi:uncharacterized protein YoaH (UPF0181 family)
MFDDISLSHEEQQQAVERIQKMMQQGMSSGQAIQTVAAEIRKNKAEETNAKPE